MTARKVQAIASIRRRRQAALKALSRYPNVVGSMIGHKLTAGKVRKRLGLTIFVSRKPRKTRLKRGDRLPKSVRVDGVTIGLDVIEIKRLRNQAGAFPAHKGLLTYDRRQTGSLSCLCSSSAGIVGLTCAHSLAGGDGDPTTPTPVAIWSESLSKYESVGQSLFVVSGPGAGVPGEFGFADAGIFSIEHADLLAMAANAIPTPSVSAAVGTRVHALGAMRGRRTGEILGVEQVLYGVRSDYVIKVDPPGTFGGDSGMLWRNATGEPVAIHAKGPGQGALLTAAMSAARAESRLGVEFLSEPS